MLGRRRSDAPEIGTADSIAIASAVAPSAAGDCAVWLALSGAVRNPTKDRPDRDRLALRFGRFDDPRFSPCAWLHEGLRLWSVGPRLAIWSDGERSRLHNDHAVVSRAHLELFHGVGHEPGVAGRYPRTLVSAAIAMFIYPGVQRGCCSVTRL